MNGRIKVIVQAKPENTAGWPHINFNYERETKRIMDVVRAYNPELDFDVVKYTDRASAVRDYDEDKKKYDGALVLSMTNWLGVDCFYAEKAKEDDGLPTIVACMPYQGGASALVGVGAAVRSGELPVPVLSTLELNDIARAMRPFVAIKKIRESTILVVGNRVNHELQDAAATKWGCKFINVGSTEMQAVLATVDRSEAEKIAEKWMSEAEKIVEPTRDDIIESGKMYLAIQKLIAKTGADAITIDCIGLSAQGMYGDYDHLYPCLAYYQMGNDGQVGVCEADIESTIASLLTKYMTDRPGYVSDPVIDTSSDRIIYAHCAACRKVFGPNDARACQLHIRSHAEDQNGASTEIIFPAGEKLTTVMISSTLGRATIHSSVSVGTATSESGCRSKLAAKADTAKLLRNWGLAWHHVTVFGDYRDEFMYLFKMMKLDITEEDK